MSNNTLMIPSMLDRLIDENPEVKQELFSASYQAQSEYLLSVQRDLKNLLNTRLSNLQWPSNWSSLDTSLFSYGIPDFTQALLYTKESQNKFCGMLEKIITRFESRLKDCRVTFLQHGSQPHILYLRIEGLLIVEPVKEKVLFESTLEI
jgi:type VI secretion system protein ImpF